MAERKKPRKIIWYSLLLSLLLHSIVLLLQLNISRKSHQAKKNENTSRSIRVVLKKSSKKKRQVVTTEQTGRKEKPKDEAFLSENNQSYDRQTIARQVAPFKKAGAGIKNGSKNAAKKTPVAGRAKRKKRRGKKLRFADLSLNKNNSLQHKQSRAAAALGEQNARDKQGLAQNNDFVEDVPMGDTTRLNTVEYKYYSFYRRIKQRLEQYWGKSLQQKAMALYRQGRRLPGNAIRTTSLLITLNSKGQIVRITIKGTSGVQEFDDVAVESFNRAGPFPNPPKGMIKNGSAHIEWGFVVKS